MALEPIHAAARPSAPLAAHHWTAPRPAPVSAPPTSAASTASTRPPTFQPTYPATGKAGQTAIHRQPGKDRRSDGAGAESWDGRSAGSVLRGESRCGVETDIPGSLNLGEDADR